MSFIDTLSNRLRNHPKRIVFPEGNDLRIIQAARTFATQKLGVPILLGDRSEIRKNAQSLGIHLEHIRILNPEESDDLPILMKQFEGLHRFRGLKEREIRDFVMDRNYFATLLLATNRVNALVSGATDSASSALRPILKIIPKQRGIRYVSSMLLHPIELSESGFNKTLSLADCAVIPDPTAEQLADIAVTTAKISHHITNQTPRVAFLSYTSKTKSSKNPTVAKMKSATELARKKAYDFNLDIFIDGEMQVDTALVPEVAQQKRVESAVAGQANVLIFPDLHSANICSKMMGLISGSHSYGQIITGIQKPAAEISRGASAHDILGTAVIVAAQAVDRNLLFSGENDIDAKIA